MAERKQTTTGIILTRLIQEKRLSNRAAAEIAGVSPTSIHDWKSGVSPTDFKALAKLADYLGVQLRYLLTGENEHLVPLDTLGDGADLEERIFRFRGECDITVRRLDTRRTLSAKAPIPETEVEN